MPGSAGQRRPALVPDRHSSGASPQPQARYRGAPFQGPGKRKRHEYGNGACGPVGHQGAPAEDLGQWRLLASSRPAIVLAAEQLADSADLRAGWHVLDVACGNGNATLAAARSATQAIGVDYVPALLEDGRGRAAAEGLDVEFRLGDAEDLPVATGSIDAVLWCSAPCSRQTTQQTADEIVRVTSQAARSASRPGRRTASSARCSRVITAHVAPPARRRAPRCCGAPRQHLARTVRRCSRRHPVRGAHLQLAVRFPREEFVAFFRRWYGPALKAFEALDDAGQAALARRPGQPRPPLGPEPTAAASASRQPTWRPSSPSADPRHGTRPTCICGLARPPSAHGDESKGEGSWLTTWTGFGNSCRATGSGYG